MLEVNGLEDSSSTCMQYACALQSIHYLRQALHTMHNLPQGHAASTQQLAFQLATQSSNNWHEDVNDYDGHA